MIRVHLNIYDAEGDLIDPEGASFPNLDVARDAGIAGIRSLLSAQALDGEIDLTGRLELVDAFGSILDIILFTDVVRVIHPSR
jgi:hypothetical protein